MNARAVAAQQHLLGWEPCGVLVQTPAARDALGRTEASACCVVTCGFAAQAPAAWEAPRSSCSKRLLRGKPHSTMQQARAAQEPCAVLQQPPACGEPFGIMQHSLAAWGAYGELRHALLSESPARAAASDYHAKIPAASCHSDYDAKIPAASCHQLRDGLCMEPAWFCTRRIPAPSLAHQQADQLTAQQVSKVSPVNPEPAKSVGPEPYTCYILLCEASFKASAVIDHSLPAWKL